MTNTASNDQLAAIRHTQGPLLIVAGPGSGKSFTLVERVVHLIQSGDASASTLLVISFTDKAASELRSRITKRLLELGMSDSLSGQQICTFHALCHRLLTEFSGHTQLGHSFRLVDEFEQRYSVYLAIDTFIHIEGVDSLFHGRKRDRWTQAGQICRWINKVSDEALKPDALIASGLPSLVALGNVYQSYQAMIQRARALDLAGLQTALLALLDDHPVIASELQTRFSHIMVDEYQDTNTIQEQILLRLVNSQHNLCVVGDDDQSLYRFRGASVRNLLEFPQLFSHDQVTRVDLRTNYRSHPRIIHFCRWWVGDEDWEIEDHSYRLDKTIESSDAAFDDTTTVIKIVGNEAPTTEVSWSNSVIKLLELLKDNGALSDWNQVAFLFHSVRSNEALELAAALEAHGIAVHSPRSKRFFEREEIRLVVGAFLHVFPHTPQIQIHGSRYDQETWRYYQDCLALLHDRLQNASNQDCGSWLAGRRVDLAHGKLDFSGGFCGFLYQLIQFPLFGAQLHDEDLACSPTQERGTRNLALLSQVLSRFDEIHSLSTYNGVTAGKPLAMLLNHYLRCLLSDGINEFESTASPTPPGFVSFLTIHQSKGLEFPVVFCGSLDASPWSQQHEIDEALEQAQLLRKPVFEPQNKVAEYDFKRLYYTAFTRAQNLLVLSVRNTAQHQPAKAGPFSKYLSELPNWDSDQFEPEQLSLSTLKPIHQYPELSLVKDVHLYENCPRKFRFFRVLGFANIYNKDDALGRLVRNTISDVHNFSLKNDPGSDISEDMALLLMEQNRSKMSDTDRASLDQNAMSYARDAVTTYVERSLSGQAIAAVELEIKHSTPAYSVSAKADVIRNQEGELGFRVFRAPHTGDGQEALSTVQGQREVDLFAEAASEILGESVRSLEVVNAMDGSGSVESPKYPATGSREAATHKLDATVQRLLSGVYSVSERPRKLCNHCEMQHCCDGKDCISHL